MMAPLLNSSLTLIHTGVVSFALHNFEEILLKKAELKVAWGGDG
jgi:hypothetical protein